MDLRSAVSCLASTTQRTATRTNFLFEKGLPSDPTRTPRLGFSRLREGVLGSVPVTARLRGYWEDGGDDPTDPRPQSFPVPELQERRPKSEVRNGTGDLGFNEGDKKVGLKETSGRTGSWSNSISFLMGTR